MCEGCWIEQGKPMLTTGIVLIGAELVHKVYEHNDVGGNLHCQLDDWNIEDEFWEEYTVYSDDASEEQLQVEKLCFEMFKNMTLQERASALALAQGYFDVEWNRV